MAHEPKSAATARSKGERLNDMHPDLMRQGTDVTEQDAFDGKADGVAAQYTEAVNDEKPSETVPPTALSRLGKAVIKSLAHCACSYQSVHPALLPLPDGDLPATSASHPATGDDDAD